MAIDPSKVRRFAHGSRVPGWDDAADLWKDPAVVPDPATTPVPADLRAEIEAHMAKYPDVRSASGRSSTGAENTISGPVWTIVSTLTLAAASAPKSFAAVVPSTR